MVIPGTFLLSSFVPDPMFEMNIKQLWSSTEPSPSGIASIIAVRRSGRLGVLHEFLLIEPFGRAGIAAWVTRSGSKPLTLTGIWAMWD
jgi:hypothetical protein